MFTIRIAEPEDIALIHRFIVELATYEKLAHEVVATEEGLRQFLFGSPRYAEVLIGEEEGTPVGFALFFHNFSTFLGRPGIYLEDLFVVPEKRGHGYGRKLLVHLAAIAKQRNCGRMEWAVLKWNEPAIGFYKSLGAYPIDEWSIFRLTGDALTKVAEQAGT